LFFIIISFTGFNYYRTQIDTTETPDGYVEISDYGFSFITPIEVDTLYIGVTDETVSVESGWFVAKLDGDTEQYGIIWVKHELIPLNYPRDLSGFQSFVLDTAETDGVVFSDEGGITRSEIDGHDVSNQMYWIQEGDVDTPVLTGCWRCDETDLYIMVYSLLSPDAGSLENLAGIWRFYAEHIECCTTS
jgi:hypothetical protein